MCEKEEADGGEMGRKSDGPGYYSQLLLLSEEICFRVDPLRGFLLTDDARPPSFSDELRSCYLTWRFVSDGGESFFGIPHFESADEAETPSKRRRHRGSVAGSLPLMYGFGICQ